MTSRPVEVNEKATFSGAWVGTVNKNMIDYEKMEIKPKELTSSIYLSHLIPYHAPQDTKGRILIPPENANLLHFQQTYLTLKFARRRAGSSRCCGLALSHAGVDASHTLFPLEQNYLLRKITMAMPKSLLY